MAERLELHSITCQDDDNEITFDAYSVYDMEVDVYRFISLSYDKCVRWMGQHAEDYPDTIEEDPDLT